MPEYRVLGAGENASPLERLPVRDQQSTRSSKLEDCPLVVVHINGQYVSERTVGTAALAEVDEPARKMSALPTAVEKRDVKMGDPVGTPWQEHQSRLVSCDDCRKYQESRV